MQPTTMGSSREGCASDAHSIERDPYPLVYVVIPVSNGRVNLQRLLPTLARTTYRNFRTVVIDNGSSDGSSTFCEHFFPDVMVLKNAENLGFARGSNLGIKWALKHGAKYVILINDDTEIVAPEWIGSAVALAETDPWIGFVGFEEISENDRPEIRVQHTERGNPLVPGFALLIRGTLLDNIGLLDEVFFCYCEEDDLEMRGFAAGFTSAILDIPVLHLGSATSRRRPLYSRYLSMRNEIRLMIKNRGIVSLAKRTVRILDVACNPRPFLFDPSNVAHCRIRGEPYCAVNVLLFLAAIFWNGMHLPQTFMARRRDWRKIRACRLMYGKGSGIQFRTHMVHYVSRISRRRRAP